MHQLSKLSLVSFGMSVWAFSVVIVFENDYITLFSFSFHQTDTTDGSGMVQIVGNRSELVRNEAKNGWTGPKITSGRWSVRCEWTGNIPGNILSGSACGSAWEVAARLRGSAQLGWTARLVGSGSAYRLGSAQIWRAWISLVFFLGARVWEWWIVSDFQRESVAHP